MVFGHVVADSDCSTEKAHWDLDGNVHIVAALALNKLQAIRTCITSSVIKHS